jgi:lysophospholipase L1-like esterase
MHAMKSFTSLSGLILMTALTANAQSPVVATARTDANSLQAHAELLAKKSQGRIDVYFEGDSITRRWGTGDAGYADMYANWKQNFFGWNAADFGWGGDTVQNILWRLEQGELSGVNPKVIVLMAGTNNIGDGVPAAQQAAKVQEVTGGISRIIALMQHEAPKATIVLMGITPRNGRNGETAAMPTIDAINKQLTTLADGKRVRYLTINSSLADANGKLIDGMTVDGLHLSVRGYQVWADALKPVFTELLGPPAKTDRAPPPSGDPSARKP